MPVTVLSPLPLTEPEITALWQAVRVSQNHPDDDVALQAVSSAEIRSLNQRFRNTDRPTNVLTFTYPAPAEGLPPEQNASHDVSLCLDVAGPEAAARGLALRDYVALLLVHAFLHVCGLDHESSDATAATTSQLEEQILRAQGFAAVAL